MKHRNECQWAIEQLDAYRRRELGQRETMRLEDHLAACDACRQEFSRDAMLVAALEQTPEHTFAIPAWTPDVRRRRIALVPALAGMGLATAVAMMIMSFYTRPVAPPTAQATALDEPDMVAAHLMGGAFDGTSDPVRAIVLAEGARTP